MIRRRSTPRHSFHSRSSSAYAQQQPQPQSSHVFTSLSGYPGWGSVAQASACSLSLSQPASAPPRPLIRPQFSERCLSVFSSPNLSSFKSNPSTRNLASFVDALDAASSISPLSATLTKNTRGWGSPSSSQNLAAPNHRSPVTAPVLSLPPVTSHRSQITKSFIIRTYAKCARNSFGMNTSKTQDLKLFRINTYKKTGGGVPPLRSG